MFVNISNHPSSKWGEKQLEAARDLAEGGGIVDIPFPNVPADAGTEEVQLLCEELQRKVSALGNARPLTVHIMGETSLVVSLSRILEGEKIPQVVSTTERSVVEKDGVKTSVFSFKRFRKV